MRGLFAALGYCLLGGLCGYAGGALLSRAERGDWLAALEGARIRSWLIALAIAGVGFGALAGVPVAQIAIAFVPRVAELILMPTLIVTIFVHDASRRYRAGRRLKDDFPR